MEPTVLNGSLQWSSAVTYVLLYDTFECWVTKLSIDITFTGSVGQSFGCFIMLGSYCELWKYFGHTKEGSR
ncbi:hypothetical protein P8452_15412 [Trifolium repens]|nr:hypothetical protein P8452_15412 [Trifolium repens]